ncbi:hypothetical protein EBX93_16130, partial [bacterium]|nr:hypothetical protein [bacterium]
KNEIGEPISLGIGINSGKIWVGNTGSSIKFKYGPLGPAVNLASRVEGLTKYLRIPLLITGETKAAVKNAFDTRRLCKVRVVNMTEPVDIYQVFLENSDKHIGLTKITENALTELENGNFRAAAKIAGYALGDYPDDGPLLHILNRAVQEMVHPSQLVFHNTGTKCPVNFLESNQKVDHFGGQLRVGQFRYPAYNQTIIDK